MTEFTNNRVIKARDPHWESKAEVEELKETVKEFTGYHKKHIFDDDMTIAMGYEEIIEAINAKIKQIEATWKS